MEVATTPARESAPQGPRITEAATTNTEGILGRGVDRSPEKKRIAFVRIRSTPSGTACLEKKPCGPFDIKDSRPFRTRKPSLGGRGGWGYPDHSLSMKRRKVGLCNHFIVHAKNFKRKYMTAAHLKRRRETPRHFHPGKRGVFIDRS